MFYEQVRAEAPEEAEPVGAVIEIDGPAGGTSEHATVRREPERPAPETFQQAEAAAGKEDATEDLDAPDAENADPEPYDADDEKCPDVEMSAGEDAMDTA